MFIEFFVRQVTLERRFDLLLDDQLLKLSLVFGVFEFDRDLSRRSAAR